MFNVFHEHQPLRKSHIIISHRRTSLKVFISSNIQLASSHRPPTLLPTLCTHSCQAFCHVGVFVFTTGDGQVSLHCYFVSHVFSRECVYFCFVYRLLTFTRVLFSRSTALFLNSSLCYVWHPTSTLHFLWGKGQHLFVSKIEDWPTVCIKFPLQALK